MNLKKWQQELSKENKSAPKSVRFKWRKAFHLSPAFNLFFYVIMIIFVLFNFSGHWEQIGETHWVWDAIRINKPLINIILSIVASLGVLGLGAYIFSKVFNKKIPIPPENKQILILGDTIVGQELGEGLKGKFPDNDFLVSPNSHIKNLLKYEVIISLIPLDESTVEELDEANISVVRADGDLEDEEELDKLLDTLKNNVFKQHRFATLNKIGRKVSHLFEVVISKMSEGLERLAQMNQFKFIITLTALTIGGVLCFKLIGNTLLLKMVLVFLCSAVYSVVFFNVVYVFLFQMDSISILFANLLTETLPYGKIQIALNKLNSETSFNDWYKKHIIPLFDLGEEASPLVVLERESKKGEWMTLFMSLSVYVLSNIAQAFFYILNLFLQGFKLKTVYKILYIPLNLIMGFLIIAHLIIDAYLFSYAIIFNILSLLLVVLTGVIFFNSTSFLLDIWVWESYGLIEGIILSVVGLFFLGLSIFLGHNILKIVNKTTNYYYYFGDGSSRQGIVNKYLLDWREGVYKSQIKASLYLGLILACFTCYTNITKFLNNEYPNVSYSKVAETKTYIKTTVKSYELNPKEVGDLIKKQWNSLYQSAMPEIWLKQIEEYKNKQK